MKKRTIVSLVLALTLVLFAVPAYAAEVPPTEGIVLGADVSVDSLPASLAAKVKEKGDVQQISVAPMNEEGNLFLVTVLGEAQYQTHEEAISRAARRGIVLPAAAAGPVYGSMPVSSYIVFLDDNNTEHYAGEWFGNIAFYYDRISQQSAVYDIVTLSVTSYAVYSVRAEVAAASGFAQFAGYAYNASGVEEGRTIVRFYCDYSGNITTQWWYIF